MPVDESKKDLTHFDSLIKRGKPVEEAAEMAGVPIAEAHTRMADSRAHRAFDDDTLRIAAAEALYYGLDKLIEIARAPPMVTSRETTDEDGLKTTEKIEATNLDAAKALVRFALDARRQLGINKGIKPEDSEEPEDGGAWKLRT